MVSLLSAFIITKRIMLLFIILAVFLYIIPPRNIYSGASANYPFITLCLPPKQHIIFEQGGSLCQYTDNIETQTIFLVLFRF